MLNAYPLGSLNLAPGRPRPINRNPALGLGRQLEVRPGGIRRIPSATCSSVYISERPLSLEFPVWAVAYAALVGLGAGYVKGYSGFAFSMIMVLALSVVFPPAKVVPAVLILETLANIWLLPSAWKDAHWPSLRLLLAGLVVGTPVGVLILTEVPPGPMRGAIAVVVLAIVLVLKGGRRLPRIPGSPAMAGMGIFSGFLNGSAAVGGMPVSVLYFSSPLPAVAGRASLIVYLCLAGLWATGTAAWQGLVDDGTLISAAALLLPVLVGILLGIKFFQKASDASFRGAVLNILVGLSVAGLFRSIFW